jgi:hypothetical protein
MALLPSPSSFCYPKKTISLVVALFAVSVVISVFQWSQSLLYLPAKEQEYDVFSPSIRSSGFPMNATTSATTGGNLAKVKTVRREDESMPVQSRGEPAKSEHWMPIRENESKSPQHTLAIAVAQSNQTRSPVGARNKNGTISKEAAKTYPGKAFRQNRSQAFLQSTEPWFHNNNITSLGYWRRHFHSGFRNQIMAFSAFVMWAGYGGHQQIVFETLKHKDTYGSDRMLPHEYLFDVQHWNTWYPKVPRMVRCVNFTDLDCETLNWVHQEDKCSNPFAKGEPFKLFGNYMRYAKGRGKLAEPTFRNPIDVAILQGALQPHPDIRELMNQVLRRATKGSDYWTLHARVEPDMQKHPVCRDFKVTNLTDIFDMLEQTFPAPPAPMLFLPINRPMLEKDAVVRHKIDKTNWLAIDNLQTLNRAKTHGLWNGTVRVFELGSTVLNGTKYEKTPSTIGAMMNFFLAIESKVFVGTRTSSWSNDVTASRFYRGNLSNYEYLPDGIELWTKSSMTNPPGFLC